MKTIMTDQELFGEVEKAIRTVFRVNGTSIEPGTTLIGDLGAESIDFLDLGFDLEKIVDAEIDFRKLFANRHDLTVQELVDHMKAQAELESVASEAAV